MAILDDIIDKVKDKPSFWQFAFDKLVRNNQITDDDYSEIIRICKIEAGLLKDTFIPVDLTKLVSQAGGANQCNNYILSKIYAIDNVNALSSSSSLEFGSEGLTVIYGDNGSGKSSYVSILKHICNTRGKKPVINDNLYDSTAQGKDKKAKVEYTCDNTNFDSVSLTNTEIDKSVLKNIDVFDTHSANHYIEGQDEIAFIPHGLSLLERLSSVLQDVESYMKEEILKTESQKFDSSLLQLTQGSQAQCFINNLNFSTTIDKLREHTNVNKTKIDKRTELQSKIEKLKSEDPQKTLKNNIDKIQRFTVLQKKIYDETKVLKGEALVRIKKIVNDFIIAKKALKDSSEKVFTDLPLEGIGGDSWKSLWESARKFFEQTNGKNSFPDTTDESICPLCLQSMGSEAKSRFDNFEKFVQNDVQKKYDICLESYKKVQTAINSLTFDYRTLMPTIEEVDKVEEGFKGSFEEYVSVLTKQKESIIKILLSEKAVEIINEPEFDVNSETQVNELIQSINTANKKLKTLSIVKELKILNDELNDLLDCEKLKKFKPKLAREIYRLRKVDFLNKCKVSCTTRSLTTISNSLSATHITQKIQDSFKDELKKLGFKNIKIETKTRGSRGKQYHFLKLDEPNSTGKIALKDILSEGEHRCIAFATFLSELTVSDHKSAIIFDDPVSSLDHKWRNKISKRIAEESLIRQVIIFTHDIAFLQMIQEHSIKLGCKLKISSLTRKKKETGIIASNPPWDALTVKKRLGMLKSSQQMLIKIERDETEEVYKERVKPLYGKLRETWERFVEEVVLDSIVQRFGRTIQTQRLKKLIKLQLTDQDYKKIDENMSKCSTYFDGHDSAGPLIEEYPNSAEFLDDINTLETFRVDIEKRKK